MSEQPEKNDGAQKDRRFFNIDKLWAWILLVLILLLIRVISGKWFPFD